MDAHRELSYIPQDFPVPAWVRERDGTAEAVWVNTAGGATFRLADGYLKWLPAGTDADAEIARLTWAGRYVRVPAVVGRGVVEGRDWILTSTVPGTSAVSHEWLKQPQTAAAAIGAGLRHLHDSLPVQECPFDWSVESRLQQAGIDDAEATRHLGPTPAIDQLVVCHGDPCAPNTMIDDQGHWSAHVDMDALGTADRWADLAVATYSLEWNYGPGLDSVLLDAYGIAPDPARTAYYRGLWDLT